MRRQFSIEADDESGAPDAHAANPLTGLGRPFDGDNSPMDVLDFYGDESCCTGGLQYFVLGGIVIRRSLVSEMEGRLQTVRAFHGGSKEMKWTKISRYHLAYYIDYVNVFFGAAARGEMSFTGLYVDAHTFNHRRYNQGQADIGVSKLFYQLLLHKVGKEYGSDHRITVMLDERTGKDDPDDLRPMLNLHLKRRFNIHTFPFKRIEFRDSKRCELIQLNDLLVGALGFVRNRKPEAAAHKVAFAEHVMARAKETCAPHHIEGQRATTFKVWPFKYPKG